MLVKRLGWAIAASAFLAVSANQSHAASYIPTNADEILQKVPAQSDARVHRYLDLKRRLAADTGNVGIADQLANAYIDFGRETGDVRYLGYAEAVIKPWLRQTTVPIPVAISYATILQSRHAFAEARKLLEEILKRAPGNLQGWLTLATVAQVQGDIPAANHACMRSADTGGPFFGIACTAQLRLVTGHADQTYALLSQIEIGATGEPNGVKAWVEGLMADAAAYQGEFELAETHFRQALAELPGDNFLLAEYSDFLLDQNRPQEALDLLKGDTQSDTSYLRMAFAKVALKTPDAAMMVWTMAARFAAMDAVGSHLYQREQARFALSLQNDPHKALALARENWIVQRAPWDVRIYLEAALAADQPQAAQPVLDFIEQTHLHSVQIDPLVDKVRAAISRNAASKTP